MAIKNLTSLYDLVQDGEVNNMESQTGPNFSITGPGVERGGYPFSVPNGSQLHAGPLGDQAGRSLVGPNFQYAYGGAATSVNPSILDNDGVTPDQYVNNLPE